MYSTLITVNGYSWGSTKNKYMYWEKTILESCVVCGRVWRNQLPPVSSLTSPHSPSLIYVVLFYVYHTFPLDIAASSRYHLPLPSYICWLAFDMKSHWTLFCSLPLPSRIQHPYTPFICGCIFWQYRHSKPIDIAIICTVPSALVSFSLRSVCPDLTSCWGRGHH